MVTVICWMAPLCLPKQIQINSDSTLRMKVPRFRPNEVYIKQLVINLQAVKQSGLMFWPNLYSYATEMAKFYA